MGKRFYKLLGKEMPKPKEPSSSNLTRTPGAFYGPEQIHRKIPVGADRSSEHCGPQPAPGRGRRALDAGVARAGRRTGRRAFSRKPKCRPTSSRAKVEEELSRIPRVSGDTTTGQGLYVTQRLNKLLAKAQDEAKRLKDEYVSVEHLALAMFDEPADSGIGKVFKGLNIQPRRISQGPHRSSRQPTRHQRQSGGHL